MPRIGDIREYKRELRARYRKKREDLDPAEKSRLDGDILGRFLRLNQYASSNLILTYVSTPIEVDTRGLINRALSDGKRVAVPRCIDGTREMEFYEIHSVSELKKRTFGVLEPDDNPERLVTDFKGSLCVVPALCFDNFGYRLGYGKGYYDRFLSGYGGVKVGICYSFGVRGRLIHGRFDCPVDVIVTERYIKTAALAAKNNRLDAIRKDEKHERRAF